MRKLIFGLLLSLGAATPVAVQAGDLNIGVVISGEVQPGVYGQVELGNRPPPPVVYERPRVIRVDPRHHYDPVYLHVPPGHARNWGKFCGRYNACNRPVYFVKSAEYEPNYHRDHDHGRDEGRHDDRGHDDHDRDDHDHDHGKHGDH
jgi:hypothetical protein